LLSNFRILGKIGGVPALGPGMGAVLPACL
jgi:hypothetical protein